MAGLSRTLAVDLGAGLVVSTPVMVAAGCAGTGRELGELVDLRTIGAVVSRSITLHPEKGAPTPRIAETSSGIVWTTGVQNPGVEAFVTEELPHMARGGTHVIVSIAGRTLEDYVRMTGLLQGRPEVAAIETYLAGPDDELHRPVLGVHADRVAEIVGAVARMSLVPTFAKLPLTAPDLVVIARDAVRAGAHGLTIGGPPPALGVRAGRLRPALGAVTGWLSGPAVKPLMLGAVFSVARALPQTPLVAVGGIRTGEDVVEALLAGAWAVQVGTAALIDPAAPVNAAHDVARYLKSKGLASPADVRGRLRVPASFDALVDSTAETS